MSKSIHSTPQTQVFSQQISLLYALTPSLCGVQILLCSLMVFGLSNSVNKVLLLVIWLILIAGIGIDFLVFLLFQNRTRQASLSKYWFYAFCTSKSLMAWLWGVSAAHLLSMVTPSEQWFLILSLLLAVSLAGATLLSSRVALSVTVIGMLFPVMVWLLINNSQMLSWVAVCMLLLGIVFVIARHWFQTKQTRQAIQDHLDNAHLKQALLDSERHIKLLKRRVNEADARDDVTALPNRTYFDDLLASSLLRAQQTHQAVSVLLVDIDDFDGLKKHSKNGYADECLKYVADALKGGLHRPTDCVARYEDDAFIVLLPSTPQQGAMTVADTLRRSISSLSQHWVQEGEPRITVSIGVTSCDFQQGLSQSSSSLGVLDECEPVSCTAPNVDRALLKAQSKAHEMGGDCVQFQSLSVSETAEM